jgi:hypothetical protein
MPQTSKHRGGSGSERRSPLALAAWRLVLVPVLGALAAAGCDTPLMAAEAAEAAEEMEEVAPAVVKGE